MQGTFPAKKERNPESVTIEKVIRTAKLRPSRKPNLSGSQNQSELDRPPEQRKKSMQIIRSDDILNPTESENPIGSPSQSDGIEFLFKQPKVPNNSKSLLRFRTGDINEGSKLWSILWRILGGRLRQYKFRRREHQSHRKN
ncbi:hypothetical protein RND81_07G058800 [Saponaria officinalis]|uniref:Uncharacterized protein n=1 Tax=Saponaria officinalis TaxID=3572 RepID=A0AAW1JS88_SAPOF